MKRFKNKAEEIHYLLHPREVERRTSKSGKVFRIYDDGNYKTFHIFTIEKLRMFGNTKIWETVTRPTADWKEVSDELNKLLEN